MTNHNNAYITSLGTFLPGQPISNEDMEKYLGTVDGKSSRLRSRILKSNGIRSRHYALDRQQHTTYQNSELAANAARNCLDRSVLDLKSIEMLAVASTQGDLPLPGMASIVQSLLKLPPCEILTTHGVCSSSLMALKSASNQIRLAQKRNALICASELASRLLKNTRYEEATDSKIDFEAEFLRWMLSDGAAAALVQSSPKQNGISLRIDWIEILSFASDFDLCMSCGTTDQKAWTPSFERTDHQQTLPTNSNILVAERVKNSEKLLEKALSWQDYPTYGEAGKAGALLIRQNLRTLEAIVRVGIEGLLRLISSGRISVEEIDHFVCHYSSHYFREEILKLSKLLGCFIPEEKWFTNLYTKGNTGCAAIFIALDELFSSGRLHPGQTVFCVVPESGRFCTAYMRMTVVGE